MPTLLTTQFMSGFSRLEVTSFQRINKEKIIISFCCQGDEPIQSMFGFSENKAKEKTSRQW